MPEVHITIKPDATVAVEAKQVAGADCVTLTREIEKAIGKTVADVKKPEFHQAATAGRKATQ